MNKLMGLSVYVPLQCSRTIQYTDREDLMTSVLSFIRQQTDEGE